MVENDVVSFSNPLKKNHFSNCVHAIKESHLSLNPNLSAHKKSSSCNQPNPAHATRPCLNTSAGAWVQVTR